MGSAGYSGTVSLKLEGSGPILEKYKNIKFRENPSSGSRVLPCRQAGGQL
jgi:hypothetical protein